MGWFGYLTLFLYYVYFLYQMYKVEGKCRSTPFANQIVCSEGRYFCYFDRYFWLLPTQTMVVRLAFFRYTPYHVSSPHRRRDVSVIPPQP